METPGLDIVSRLLIVFAYMLILLFRNPVKTAIPKDPDTLETIFDIAEAAPTSFGGTESMDAVCAGIDAKDIPAPLSISHIIIVVVGVFISIL